MEIEIVVKKSLWIPVDEIIEENKLTDNSTDSEIMDAVDDYVSGLDSCDYDLIEEENKKEIEEFLKNYLTNKR